MPTFDDKISHLESYLLAEPSNYRDSFKMDIYYFFNAEFDQKNPFLEFLKEMSTFSEIEDWVDRVTSNIVLKFDEEQEQINDFIFEFVELVEN